MFCSTSFSRPKRSLSLVSLSWFFRVKSPRSFLSMALPLALLQNQCDGRGHPLPLAQFFFQLVTARARERIELGPAIIVRSAPSRADPAALLQAVEGRVKRSLAYLQDILGNLLDALGDSPAVHGLKR